MAQFTYSCIVKSPTYSVVREKLRKRLGKEYENFHEAFTERRIHMMTPILLQYCPVREMGRNIEFVFENETVTIPKSLVDVFCFSYREGLELSAMMCVTSAAAFSMGNYDYSEACVVERKEEIGQNKIMLSTMATLIDSPREVHMLVIGSSSEGTTNAGRTYDALIDLLPACGYKGSLTMIDPYEPARQFKVGDPDNDTVITVTTYKEKYDYEGQPLFGPNGEEMTHVWDDVWVPNLTKDIHDPIDFDRVNIRIPEGTSKFAYRIDGSTIAIRGGLNKHKEMRGAIGGGYVRRFGESLYFYGTSTGTGPYSRDLLLMACQEYAVTFSPHQLKRGRLAYDPNANVFKHYPNARVSVKHFGESYERPKHYIAEQTWYAGLEKRLITNMRSLGPTGHMGCGCDHCIAYDVILSHFKVYTPADKAHSAKRLLTRVIRDKCLVYQGTSFHQVCGVWMSAARLNATYGEALKTIRRQCSVREMTAERAYRFLVKNGKLSAYKSRVYEYPLNSYTKKVVYQKEERYYRRGGVGEEYITRNGTSHVLHDPFGRKITEDRRDTRLIYRPSVTSRVTVDVVEYFAEKYGKLFCSIDGYDIDTSGSRHICGFDLTFPYAIVKETGDYMPIEVYRSWALTRTF